MAASAHRFVGGSTPLRGRGAAWLVLVLLIPATAAACLWDVDTLPQERSRFPSTLELITGKFLRHSPEFYAWRIEDRKRRLAADPDQIPLYDDLAVAYQKTGRHDLAVETILKKEALKPGLYETYSNLGTFYILQGDFEKGLPFIDKALAINPDAHFGREKYQKQLVEYAMERRVDGKLVFPLFAAIRRDGRIEVGDGADDRHQIRPEDFPDAEYARKPGSFADFIRRKTESDAPIYGSALRYEERTGALNGVQGMMRFADHDNPLLLEALASLLLLGHEGHDAKLLAARAHLAAGAGAKSEEERKLYEAAAETLVRRSLEPRPEVRKQFAAEQADADAWYADLASKEREWIRDGVDPEGAFNALYASEPAALDGERLYPTPPPPDLQAMEHRRRELFLAGLGVSAAVLATSLALLRWRRRDPSA